MSGCGGYSGPGNKPSTLAITTTSPLTAGTMNAAYSASLAAAGGTAPYTWSVISGTLPKGISLSGAGVLSGTPTVAGSNSFTVQVADSGRTPQTASLAATLAISDSAVSIATTTLPLAAVSVAYTATLAATGGTAPYTWSVTAGALPAGLALSAAGVLSGAPTVDGVYKFTVQASDSFTTPQTASAALQLLVSGGMLAITTTALPAGQQGTAYPATQLAATGGVPPYAWSVGATVALPPGLALSAAGVLSGTPTGVSSASPQFVVTDSANASATQSLKLLIAPAQGSIPDGDYSFYFAGTTPQGSSSAPNAVGVTGTFAIKGGTGTVISGVYDENTNTDTTPASDRVPSTITGGSLVNGGDGLGTLVLNTGSGATMTFALATPPSVGLGTSSDIRIIEFDDTTGTGSRGSGVLRPAAPNPTTGSISGDFSFLFTGTDLNQREQALIGSFKTDGAGNITSGRADSNQAGALFDFPVVFGTYAVAPNGRGLLRLNLGGGPGDFSFAFYQITPAEWLVVSLDPATLNSPLVIGIVRQQTGGPFSVASLPTKSVLEVGGLEPKSPGVTVPDISLGVATSDGAGNVTYTFDEYNGSLLPGLTQAVKYAVDPTTGRAVSQETAQPQVLYIINGSSAFILDPDESTSSGIIEAQTGSPFALGSFSGDYLGGSLPQVNTSVLNEAGIVSADGSGNVLITTNRSSSGGLVFYNNVSGTYAVSSAGRIVVTAPDGITRIFYVVSPTKVAYLTSDTGGYLGTFEQ